MGKLRQTENAKQTETCKPPSIRAFAEAFGCHSLPPAALTHTRSEQRWSDRERRKGRRGGGIIATHSQDKLIVIEMRKNVFVCTLHCQCVMCVCSVSFTIFATLDSTHSLVGYCALVAVAPNCIFFGRHFVWVEVVCRCRWTSWWLGIDLYSRTRAIVNVCFAMFIRHWAWAATR